MEYQYPLAEPDYTGKRTLDFTPFEEALAALSADRTAVLDELLAEATLLDMQRLMAQGELSATELVAYYVARIRRYDVGKLNAVMELNPHAPAIAQALDAERANGRIRGPLHGIPVLIKDNIATGDGMHTAAGAWALRDWQPRARCVPGGAAAQGRGRDPGQDQPVGVGELHGPVDAKWVQRAGWADALPVRPV